MRLHPTFYVGRLKAYLPADLPLVLPHSSVSAQSPTPPVDDAADDWDQVLPDGVQTRSAEALQKRQYRVGEDDPPTPAAPVKSSQQPPSQPPHDLEHSRPSHEHLASHSSPPQSQHEGNEARHSTAQAPDYENRRPTQEAFRRDAPPPLVDASCVQRWIVDRIVGHEDPTSLPPYYDKKSAKATDAADSFHDPANRNVRELAIDDDPPSDFEVYNGAREHLDTLTVESDYENDLGGRKTNDLDYVNASIDRQGGIPRAHTMSSHSCRIGRGLSM
uniref:Uncharacterized protein n=1 Tax=Peronospora matthiolae TaxID=2874970 RepID=A0AAV1VL95_9STRA